ncbi:MAG: ATP-dependent carboxylate-amine ligase [Pseudonocardiales bacterium]|nr:ATP-dependent carboxylate-amine ligase [Pseudonocardiales bacterium]
MRQRTVLTIGEYEDWSADSVADELTRRGVRNYRLDTADFPQRMKMSARNRAPGWCGRIETAAGQLDLEEVTAVYYRKPRQFDLSPALSEPERRFARAQARVGVGGVLSSLRVRWMNLPAAIADAESKPRQLDIAADVGLATPPTLISNDPSDVRAFAADVGRIIVKPLAEPIVHEGGGYTAVYTRIVASRELDSLAGVAATAHLFQAWVPKSYEVRVKTRKVASDAALVA